MKRKILFTTAAFSFVAAMLISTTAMARTHIVDSYPQLGRGVRPLGMGNAFLTMKGTDENVIFYNPAAINDYSQKFKFRFLSPSVGFNYGIIGTIEDTLNLNDDLGKTDDDSAKIGLFETFINKHSGEFHNVYINLPIATMMHKYITFSLLVDGRETFSFRNRAFPNFEVRSRNDGGLIVGSAYSFFMDDLQVGLAVKFLERIMIDKVVTTNDITGNKDLGNLFKWAQWKKGFGVGADVGVKYKLKNIGPDFFYFFDPIIAVTYQDIANTRFTGGAEKTPQSVNAGVGIHPTFGDYGTSLEIAFTEVNQRKDILNKFHAGAELRFPKVISTHFAIRAGCNQGYPSSGFTADWKYAKLEFAFFGEEMGQYTHSKVNWNLAVNLSFGL